MDISLHSFILVVGVIVIGFIVWDGVKKVRAARANQLDPALENYDSLDMLSESQDLPVFDDLEIKDELLQQALTEEYGESFSSVKLNAQPALKTPVPEGLTDSVDDIEGTSTPVFEILASPEIKTQSPESQAKPFVAAIAEELTTQAQDDGFEHFTACDDELAAHDSDQIVAKRTQVSANAKDQIDSEQVVRASTVLAKKTTEQTKPVPQRISKEALAVQLAKVKQESKPAIEKTVIKTEEIELDDKEPVPVLMEPVELGQKVDPNPPKQHELVLPELIQQTLQDEPVYAVESQPAIKASKPDLLMEYIEDVQALPVGEKLSEREAAKEIFVINILKQDGKGLRGQDLHHVFKVCDMRHGEMNIYHRFEKANAQGKIQFSVVNAIEPGTFDIHHMNELVTPGISLFMSLPGPDKPMEAFDAMAEVALVFARNFDATLHDDTHSDLTPQTLEHYRNRVREFSRKHLSHKK
ncbi:MAG: cell division protein ZipA [Oceanicoccus sp.]|jgi:cell division protein ZipA